MGKGFQLVVAATKNGLGIGKNGSLPWASLPGDMAYFKELTSRTRDSKLQNVVIMGRKTWDSIPAKFRPLKGRINIVLSRSFGNSEHSENDSTRGNVASGAAGCKLEGHEGVYACSSLEAAEQLLDSPELKERVENVFVIGGGQVYKEAISSPRCTAIHLTQVDKDFECDTHFPEIDSARFKMWSASQPLTEQDGTRYTFLCYTSTSEAEAVAASLPPAMASRHEEMQVHGVVGMAGHGMLGGSWWCMCIHGPCNMVHAGTCMLVYEIVRRERWCL